MCLQRWRLGWEADGRERKWCLSLSLQAVSDAFSSGCITAVRIRWRLKGENRVSNVPVWERDKHEARKTRNRKTKQKKVFRGSLEKKFQQSKQDFGGVRTPVNIKVFRCDSCVFRPWFLRGRFFFFNRIRKLTMSKLEMFFGFILKSNIISTKQRKPRKT